MYLSSIIDHLTGFYNSGYLRKRVHEEIKRYRRTGGDFGIVFLDLDNFKGINDSHGHLVGDQVLKQIAGVLKENVRSSEVLVRYGGDEFVLLMPGAGKDQGRDVIKRLRQAVKSMSFPDEDVTVGLSGGAAFFPEDGSSLDQLLAVTDKRMYKEKA